MNKTVISFANVLFPWSIISWIKILKHNSSQEKKNSAYTVGENINAAPKMRNNY